MYILALTMVLSLQYSCNKLLDLKPLNEISDADYWKTPEQFKLAANEFYTYLLTFGNVLYDGPHSDLRSDFSLARNTFSNGTNTVPQTDGSWNGGYSRLRAINYLLQKQAPTATRLR